MSGPNSSDREALRERGSRLESLGQSFGWAVGVGLVIEYGQEIIGCFVNSVWPSWSLIGGLIVTLGVFGEVWFSSRALKTAEELSDRADSDVALANERAAEALERASKADLARAKIEQRMKPRDIVGEDSSELQTLLAKYPNQSIDILVFDPHVPEVKMFALQLLTTFVKAGWRVKQWHQGTATFRAPGASMMILVAVGGTDKFLDLSSGLLRLMNERNIDCGVAFESFSDKKDFEPGSFRLMLREPFMLGAGSENLAPFRIQIGAMQLVSPGKGTVGRGIAAPPKA